MEFQARPARRKQRGVLIVLIMAGIAVAAILSGVAAQKWSDVIRRDKEAEMIFRAQDIVRALKRFQKDRGHLPNTWDELKEPGQKGQYFIRQLWKDPLVRGGKWQTLYAAPQGGIVDPTMVNVNGASTGGDEGASSDAEAPAAPVPPLGSGSETPTGRPQGIPEVTKNEDGTAELGGLPIAGVKSRCKDPPFRVYKERSSYSLWLFSVFDLEGAPGGVGGLPAPGAPGQVKGTKTPDAGSVSFPPR